MNKKFNFNLDLDNDSSNFFKLIEFDDIHEKQLISALKENAND